MFALPKTVIGCEVNLCHLPASSANVEEIVEILKPAKKTMKTFGLN